MPRPLLAPLLALAAVLGLAAAGRAGAAPGAPHQATPPPEPTAVPVPTLQPPPPGSGLTGQVHLPNVPGFGPRHCAPRITVQTSGTTSARLSSWSGTRTRTARRSAPDR
jgi:hypothetical protein